MNQMTSAQRDRVMSDLRVVIADTEELLRMTAGQAGESAANLRARLEARMQQAKAELASAQHSVVAQAQVAGRAVDEFVHQNSWKAMGIAASVGLLVGLLIVRR